ncbi:hypothetical protein PFLU4_36140 [Pseudomonas fluorescens]|nr:hypothetical protein PFLU4_36140 [Pseudomonas fluorescens]
MTDRLSRGDVARAGVLALERLLAMVITEPSDFLDDTELRSAIKSQAGLASLDRVVSAGGERGINTFPTSLNTLKKYSDESLVGGFNSLNALRIKAIEAFEREERKKAKSNKRTKAGLSLKVTDVESELEMLRQTNYLLLRALQEALGQIQDIRVAKDLKTLEKWSSDAIASLLSITSLCIPPFNLTETTFPNATSTVTDINDYRKKDS